MGACFGSFISLITYRLPKQEDIVFKSSYCPKCNSKLGIINLIPIISYTIQKAKCHICKHLIHPRYFIIEIISVIVSTLLYYKHHNNLNLPFALDLGIYLTILSMIITDLENLIVPNELMVVLFLLSSIQNYIINDNFLENYYSSILLGSLLYAMGKAISFCKKRESLGLADVKFVISIGCMIPMVAIPSFLLLAGIIGTFMGLIYAKLFDKKEFPFIPPLAISAILCFNKINILTFIVS